MYLSIVCVTRDDNYGERAKDRFASFARSIPRGTDWELIVVEWNPLEYDSSKKPMIEIINNLDLPYKARVITVPFTEHRRLLSIYPVLEYYGKNLGLIHSRGQFVLFTNPDIVFPSELFDHICKHPFHKDYIYRASRYDVDRNVLDSDNLIEACRTHIIAQHLADEDPGNAAGDFTLVHNSHAKAVGGYVQTTLLFTYLDSEFVERLRKERNLTYKLLPMPIYHIDHDRTDKCANLSLLSLACKYYNPVNMGLKDAKLIFYENKCDSTQESS